MYGFQSGWYLGSVYGAGFLHAYIVGLLILYIARYNVLDNEAIAGGLAI